MTLKWDIYETGPSYGSTIAPIGSVSWQFLSVFTMHDVLGANGGT